MKRASVERERGTPMRARAWELERTGSSEIRETRSESMRVGESSDAGDEGEQERERERESAEEFKINKGRAER